MVKLNREKDLAYLIPVKAAAGISGDTSRMKPRRAICQTQS